VLLPADVKNFIFELGKVHAECEKGVKPPGFSLLLLHFQVKLFLPYASPNELPHVQLAGTLRFFLVRVADSCMNTADCDFGAECLLGGNRLCNML